MQNGYRNAKRAKEDLHWYYPGTSIRLAATAKPTPTHTHAMSCPVVGRHIASVVCCRVLISNGPDVVGPGFFAHDELDPDPVLQNMELIKICFACTPGRHIRGFAQFPFHFYSSVTHTHSEVWSHMSNPTERWCHLSMVVVVVVVRCCTL